MSSRIPSGMAQVAALTRAGKLTEATAKIQQLLGGTPAPVANQTTAPDAHPADLIEGRFTRLDQISGIGVWCGGLIGDRGRCPAQQLPDPGRGLGQFAGAGECDHLGHAG